MTYATAADVLARWTGTGKPSATDPVIATRVGDAETLVDAEFPNIATAITAGTLKAGVVKLVVINMVLRVFKNPEGVRSHSETNDGTFDATTVFAGDNPGALEITTLERSWLAAAAPVTANTFGGIGVLSTTRGPLETGPVGLGYCGDSTEETEPWVLM